MMQHRDVILIGAGPAGLTAGYYCSFYGFDTLIFEEKIPGGYAAEIPILENYPGYVEGITGKDLVDKMLQQCKKNGGEIHQFEKVIELNLKGKKHIVKTDKSVYSAEAVIIGSGRAPKVLGVPGEDEFRGKGVSYCAVCDGAFFKERKVIVVGDDRRTAEVAIFLSGLASHAKLVCHKEKLCAEKILIENLEKQKVDILRGMELKEIKGDINVKSVVLHHKETGEDKEIYTDGVFFQLEGIPNSQIAKESGIKVDKDDYIIADDKGRTSKEGVYAIGDVTNYPTKLIVSAVAQAAAASLDILEHIQRHA
jgi:thioredoxin reductase (NADPH)